MKRLKENLISILLIITIICCTVYLNRKIDNISCVPPTDNSGALEDIYNKVDGVQKSIDGYGGLIYRLVEYSEGY